jgi:peroxiredoxin family protein
MSELEKVTKKLFDVNDELRAQIVSTQEALVSSMKLLRELKEENDRLIAACKVTMRERRGLARTV